MLKNEFALDFFSFLPPAGTRPLVTIDLARFIGAVVKARRNISIAVRSKLLAVPVCMVWAAND